MSAYIVDRAHICYLVTAATSRAIYSDHDHATWFWGPRNGLTRGEIYCSDHEAAAQLGQMLWDENVKSVKYRYPNSTELPGPIGSDYVYGLHQPSRAEITIGGVLKAIDGLDYQSCEHPGWRDSQAKAFLESLRGTACCRVPGYDAAAWTIDGP